VIFGYGRVEDPLAVERRRLAEKTTDDLVDPAEAETQVAGQPPVGVPPLVPPRRLPIGAAKVPEIGRRVVGDEEGFAIDALRVERDRGRGVRGEQVLGG